MDKTRDAVQKGEASLGRGAELAGVPVGKIMTILNTEFKAGSNRRIVSRGSGLSKVWSPQIRVSFILQLAKGSLGHTLGLRFVVGYAGRRRGVLLHAAGNFCDSIRDFLWIVSRCAPEF
jgi:hypothetical protein